MAKVLKLKSSGPQRMRLAGKGHYEWEEESGGGGGAAVLTVDPVRTLTVRGATVDDGTDGGGLGSFDASDGPGPGKTLTSSEPGQLIVDGFAYQAGDLILYKGRNVGATSFLKLHGIYEVIAQGDEGTPWVLRRATNFDTDAEVQTGVFVTVTEGDQNAGTTWGLIATPAGIDVNMRLYFYPNAAPTKISAAEATLPGSTYATADLTVGRDLEVQGKCHVNGDLSVSTINGAPPGGGGAKMLLSGGLAFNTPGDGGTHTYRGGAFPQTIQKGAPTDPDPSIHGNTPSGGAVVPAGTLKRLRVAVDSGPWGNLNNASWAATVYKNGAATAMTVAGADGEITGADAVHTVAVAAGDTVQIKLSATYDDSPDTAIEGIVLSASVELELT